jgi:serine/threonine protein kinase
MQTFSQYAATRPLRSPGGTIAVQDGLIQTYAGVDVVTGMPVIVYTMPGQPPSIAEVINESIPVVLETGMQNETGFVVVSSAPGYLPLRLGLSQVRLEWLTRTSAKALSDAHAGGLVHGDLNPSHFFVQGDHLLLEGWGLGWQNAQADFTPPEGQGEAAADVFAWARTIQAFGKGDPRKLLDGEMGRLIGHCLNPKPQERPTALELVIALEQVIAKKTLKPEVKTMQLDPPRIEAETPEVLEQVPSETKVENPPTVTEYLETPSNQAPQPLKLEPTETLEMRIPIDEGIKIIAVGKAPERTPMIEPQAQPDLEIKHPQTPTLEKPPTPTSLPTLEPQAESELHESELHEPELHESELREPENLAADEPDIIPSARPEHEPVPLPTHDGSIEPGVVIYKDEQPSSGTIRVGFEEDDSWRSVKPYARPKSNPFILPIALVVIALLGILGVVILTHKSPPNRAGNTIQTPSIGNPSQNSIVNFIVNSSVRQTARLTVISAPSNANLVSGALLATIPGPVLFPYPGAYKVRVSMPNFAPGDVTVNVPQDKEIVVELRQP